MVQTICSHCLLSFECFLEQGFSKIRSLIFGKFISFLLVKKCVAQHEPWLLFLNIYLVVLEPLIEQDGEWYNNYPLLTEREGRTGEYWPEVVAVGTRRSEVRAKTTEGQYLLVRLEQARLISSLLYGTLFVIVKFTSCGLYLKMFIFSIYL